MNEGVVEAPSRPIADCLIGVLILIGTEVMFFAGLIVSFLILRAGSLAWAPVGQPRLPVAVTGLNTMVLIASGVTMYLALGEIRRDRQEATVRWIGITAALGMVFLAIQGMEWLRLLKYGLRVSSSPYGATFYTAIGTHGLHVSGGLMCLAILLRRAIAGRYCAESHAGLEASAFFWFFVVALWPVLYALFYLS
jgi:heme/copper-type cytochrome/quinol oxidase subunit 3